MFNAVVTAQGLIFTGLSAMLVFTQSQKEHYRTAFVIFLLTLLASGWALITDDMISTPHLRAQLIGLFFTALSGCFFIIDNYEHKQEGLMLMLIAYLGLQVLVSAKHMLTIYMGLELISFPLYSLVALSTIQYRANAALKYFLQGSFASVLFLFGLSLLFGLYGVEALNLQLVHDATYVDVTLNWSRVCSDILCPIEPFAVSLILATILFKLALVPFHFWVSDVYSKSRPSFLIFLGVVPKIAFFSVAYLLVQRWFVAQLHFSFEMALLMVLTLTVVWAHSAAFVSRHFGQLVGYSSIGQMALLGLLLLMPQVSDLYYQLGLYHLVAYALASSLLLGVALILKLCVSSPLESFRGLIYHRPFIGFLVIVAVLSLAGIPPLPGFFAKFFIFRAAVEQGYVLITTVFLITSVVACGYYLRLVTIVLSEDLEGQNEFSFTIPTWIQFLFGILLLMMVGMMIAPECLVT